MAPADPDPTPAPGDAGEPARVLLVDDSPANLLALSAVLEPLGVQLHTAASGLEALRLLLHTDYAVVVLDVNLPGGVSGFEVARLLRERERSRRTPIIFVTGKELAPGSISQGYAHGAVDYLLKPIDPDALRSKVAVFAELQRAREELRRQAELIHQQERALAAQQQRERLHAMLLQAPAAIVILRGEDFVYEFANPLAERIAGRSLPLGRPLAEVMPEVAAQPALMELLRHVLRTGEPAGGRRMQSQLDRHGTGQREEAFFDISYLPVLGADGRPEGVLSFAVDVTEQVRGVRRAEALTEEVQAGEEQLRLLTDALPVLVSYVDREHRYRQVNHAYTVRFGLSPEQLLGRPVKEVVGEAAYETVRHHIEAALRGESRTFDQEMPYPDGARHIRVHYVPHRLPSGEVLGFIGLVTDVTEQVTRARERTQLLEEAQAGVRLRDEFFSVASHELRTPITSLALQLQLLSRALPAGTQERARLATAERQVARLTSLVGSLLDVSRIAAGRLELQPAPADLRQLVREALERLAPVFGEAGCALDVSLPPEPVPGHWDVQRVDQVLVNVLSNAAKYGAGKPVHVSVAREVTPGGERALFRVRDEGIGIPEDVLPRLFGRFERGVSVRHYGGLGLGLYISRQLTEAMGGRIHVDSSAAQGTLFTVELPMGEPPTGELPKGGPDA